MARRRYPSNPLKLLFLITGSAAFLACGGNTPSSGGSSGGSSPGGSTSQSGGTGGSGGTSGGASSGGASSGVGGAGGVGGSVGGSGGASGGAAGSGGAGGGAGGGGAGGGGGSAPVVCPPTPALQPGNSDETITVDSKERNYVLHVPDSYDGSTAVPLVIDFHPLTGSGSSWSGGSPYRAQTDPDGVIVAYPSGLSGPSGGAWNVGPCCVSGTDDVAFAKALVAEIQTVACIDPKRIYAVGFSMGGGMSHYLACHAADVFAAVAPAAFDLLEENVGDCNPARPISVVSWRGTMDGLVKYEGGYSDVVPGMPITFLGAEDTFAKWAELNGCTGAPSAEDSNGCAKYTNCEAGVNVVLCTDDGGGHAAANASVTWPLLKEHVMP